MDLEPQTMGFENTAHCSRFALTIFNANHIEGANEMMSYRQFAKTKRHVFTMYAYDKVSVA
jgi:hypothetical protein